MGNGESGRDMLSLPREKAAPRPNPRPSDNPRKIVTPALIGLCLSHIFGPARLTRLLPPFALFDYYLTPNHYSLVLQIISN